MSDEDKEKREKFWEKVNNRIKEKADFKRINVYEQEGHDQVSPNCPSIKKGVLLQILAALKDTESSGSEIMVNGKAYELYPYDAGEEEEMADTRVWKLRGVKEGDSQD